MKVFSKQDRIFMRKAIILAEKGRGGTRPNPMVGAVIVKDGEILSTGYHRKAGADHAEVDAIKNSPVPVRGANIYVTLEPCSIQGRTPPCTDALISNGLLRVIIGSKDPNPKVSGSGIKILEEAGIEVSCGLFSDEIARQNEIFFKHIKDGLPFICAKIASSLDGKLAAGTSDSRWITSSVSREQVQKLRIEYGCVLTGINTVIADDPTLFPKTDPSGTIKENLKSFLDGGHPDFYRVVLDTDLRIPLDSNLLKTAGDIRTIIFAADACKNKAGSNEKIRKIKRSRAFLEFMDGRRLGLKKVLGILYSKYGIISVMLEAGPTILTSFLTKEFIDKFVIFIAPKIIGGDSPYNMFGKLKIDFIRDSITLNFHSFEKTGSDIMLTAYPEMENYKRAGR